MADADYDYEGDEFEAGGELEAGDEAGEYEVTALSPPLSPRADAEQGYDDKMLNDRRAQRRRLLRMYKAALDCDVWGQMLEAIEAYDKLVRALEKIPADLQLSRDERDLLAKLSLCVIVRLEVLRGKRSEGLVEADMRQLGKVFDELFTGSGVAGKDDFFPIDLSPFRDEFKKTDVVNAIAGHSVGYRGGSLLPPPSLTHGTGLTIKIERIGLKNAFKMVDPFFSVHVLGKTGKPIESSQDTPPAIKKLEQSLHFDVAVNIQTAVERLPGDCAIMFELKERISKTERPVCWCFLEMDEVKEGKSVLEVYEKPLDPKRKRIRLVTERPLYLYLDLALPKALCREEEESTAMLQRMRMMEAGIDPDSGIPLDPKTVTFSSSPSNSRSRVVPEGHERRSSLWGWLGGS